MSLYGTLKALQLQDINFPCMYMKGFIQSFINSNVKVHTSFSENSGMLTKRRDEQAHI